jgi:hypothetical protein
VELVVSGEVIGTVVGSGSAALESRPLTPRY